MQSRLKVAKRSRFDWQSLRCELQILLKGRVDYLLAPIEFGDCVGGFKSGRRHPFLALERPQNELVRQPASIRFVMGSALFECPHACYRTDSLPAGRTNNKHGWPIELLRPAVEVLHRNGSEVPKLRIRLPRRVRFSLRGLMVVTAVVAIGTYWLLVRPTAIANRFVAAIAKTDYKTAKSLMVDDEILSTGSESN